MDTQPNELSKRLALFYSAALMAGAFGGLLAGVITQYMDGVGNTPGWQWLFVIEGLGTVCISAVAVFILPGRFAPSPLPPVHLATSRLPSHDLPPDADYPTTTRWLTDREKKFAVARLVTNEDAADRIGHMQAFKLSVKDWKTWVSLGAG